MKFKVGDKVIFTNKEHSDYGAVGTVDYLTEGNVHCSDWSIGSRSDYVIFKYAQLHHAYYQQEEAKKLLGLK